MILPALSGDRFRYKKNCRFGELRPPDNPDQEFRSNL